jgi:hypothetical protein
VGPVHDSRHTALGSREDSPAPTESGRILRGAPAAVAVTNEVPGMADVAFLRVIAGGFPLLALMLRGLERL